MEPSIQKEVIDKAFGISPDSVYGFVVAVLCIAIIFLAYALWTFSKKYIEINVSMIQTLGDLKSMWIQTKDEIEKNNDSIHDRLSAFEKLIETKIDFFKKLNQ